MINTRTFPKIESVEPIENKCLRVTFDNGVMKRYDCKPLLKEEAFSLLRHDWFFQIVKRDVGGYGISWADEIDLSESELWEHGRLVKQLGGSGCFALGGNDPSL
ncbi:MAG: DUF2442 domain-containing protein [bacterium]|nr:DUF2442 domain-containing protein [bacterium]